MQNQIEIKISATINEDGSMKTSLKCPPDINVGKLLLVINSARNMTEQALKEYLDKMTIQTGRRKGPKEVRKALESVTLNDLYNEEPLVGIKGAGKTKNAPERFINRQ